MVTGGYRAGAQGICFPVRHTCPLKAYLRTSLITDPRKVRNSTAESPRNVRFQQPEREPGGRPHAPQFLRAEQKL